MQKWRGSLNDFCIFLFLNKNLCSGTQQFWRKGESYSFFLAVHLQCAENPEYFNTYRWQQTPFIASVQWLHPVYCLEILYRATVRQRNRPARIALPENSFRSSYHLSQLALLKMFIEFVLYHCSKLRMTCETNNLCFTDQ